MESAKYDVDQDHGLSRYLNRKGEWVMPMDEVRKAVEKAYESGRRSLAEDMKRLENQT